MIVAEPNDKKKKKKKTRIITHPDGTTTISDTDSMASSAYTMYSQNSTYSNRSIGGYSNKGKIIKPDRLIPTLEHLNITNNAPNQQIILGVNNTNSKTSNTGSNKLSVSQFAEQCLNSDRKKKMAKLNRKQLAVGGLAIPESIIEEGDESEEDSEDDSEKSDEEREWVERPKVLSNKRRNETNLILSNNYLVIMVYNRKEMKKQTKLVYKDEEKKLIHATGGGRQDINNISVFKYSH